MLSFFLISACLGSTFTTGSGDHALGVKKHNVKSPVPPVFGETFAATSTQGRRSLNTDDLDPDMHRMHGVYMEIGTHHVCLGAQLLLHAVDYGTSHACADLCDSLEACSHYVHFHDDSCRAYSNLLSPGCDHVIPEWISNLGTTIYQLEYKEYASYPTDRPTLYPTEFPTDYPTLQPTGHPLTHRPTNRPTKLPTPIKTPEPTHRPTKRPTSRPYYKSIGQGICSDSNSNEPPYCTLTGFYADTKSQCEEHCTQYGCQGFSYTHSYGCRLFFRTWDEAAQILKMTYFGSECHDFGGGEISQTYGPSDFDCYVPNKDASPRRLLDIDSTVPQALHPSLPDTQVKFVKMASGYECGNNHAEIDLGDAASVQECAQKCDSAWWCSSFIYGHGNKAGRCWSEGISFNDCTEWEEDEYDFYNISTSDFDEQFVMTKAGHECDDNAHEAYMGLAATVEACYEKCTLEAGCKSFIYGYGDKAKQCWAEGPGITRETCTTWGADSYNFYEINGPAAVEIIIAPIPNEPVFTQKDELALTVNPSDMVFTIMETLYNEWGILPKSQTLLFEGEALHTGSTIASIGITALSNTLEVSVGGGSSDAGAGSLGLTETLMQSDAIEDLLDDAIDESIFGSISLPAESSTGDSSMRRKM